MKTSDRGLVFIASQEGFVDHVYHDVANIATIGFGHVLHMGDPIHVTRDQALELLRHDVGIAEAAVNSMVKVPLNQNQFDALVDFTFNDGTGALHTSALLHLINLGAFQTAADEFEKWDHANVNGKMVEIAGLRNRRLLERAMFLAAPVEDPPVVMADAPPVLPDEGQPTPPEDLPPVV
jgi:lysozyme